jgi:DNA-directed RNA polymerase subunit RPC12/RpoP
MSIETLGEALSMGWRVTARCAMGSREAMKRVRECTFRQELDLETLVWTRGLAFPLSSLDSRLRCPRCGSRRVLVLYEPPSMRKTAT